MSLMLFITFFIIICGAILDDDITTFDYKIFD